MAAIDKEVIDGFHDLIHTDEWGRDNRYLRGLLVIGEADVALAAETYLREAGRYVPPDYVLRDLARAQLSNPGETELVVRLWNYQHHLNYNHDTERDLVKVLDQL